MAVRLDTRFEQVEDKVGAILKDVSRSCGLGASGNSQAAQMCCGTGTAIRMEYA
jgi:hypothetical protein